MPRTRRLSSIDFNANLAPTEEFLGSDIDLFLQRLVRLTFSDFKGWLLWFVWDRLAMKPCQRYLRLVGGQTACGELGGHFVGFLFDRANNVGDSFTGGNALQRRITQSFLLNFLQLVLESEQTF